MSGHNNLGAYAINNRKAETRARQFALFVITDTLLFQKLKSEGNLYMVTSSGSNYTTKVVSANDPEARRIRRLTPKKIPGINTIKSALKTHLSKAREISMQRKNDYPHAMLTVDTIDEFCVSLAKRCITERNHIDKAKLKAAIAQAIIDLMNQCRVKTKKPVNRGVDSNNDSLLETACSAFFMTEENRDSLLGILEDVKVSIFGANNPKTRDRISTTINYLVERHARFLDSTTQRIELDAGRTGIKPMRQQNEVRRRKFLTQKPMEPPNVSSADLFAIGISNESAISTLSGNRFNHGESRAVMNAVRNTTRMVSDTFISMILPLSNNVRVVFRTLIKSSSIDQFIISKPETAGNLRSMRAFLVGTKQVYGESTGHAYFKEGLSPDGPMWIPKKIEDQEAIATEIDGRTGFTAEHFMGVIDKVEAGCTPSYAVSPSKDFFCILGNGAAWFVDSRLESKMDRFDTSALSAVGRIAVRSISQNGGGDTHWVYIEHKTGISLYTYSIRNRALPAFDHVNTLNAESDKKYLLCSALDDNGPQAVMAIMTRQTVQMDIDNVQGIFDKFVGETGVANFRKITAFSCTFSPETGISERNNVSLVRSYDSSKNICAFSPVYPYNATYYTRTSIGFERTMFQIGKKTIPIVCNISSQPLCYSYNAIYSIATPSIFDPMATRVTHVTMSSHDQRRHFALTIAGFFLKVAIGKAEPNTKAALKEDYTFVARRLLSELGMHSSTADPQALYVETTKLQAALSIVGMTELLQQGMHHGQFFITNDDSHSAYKTPKSTFIDLTNLKTFSAAIAHEMRRRKAFFPKQWIENLPPQSEGGLDMRNAVAIDTESMKSGTINAKYAAKFRALFENQTRINGSKPVLENFKLDITSQHGARLASLFLEVCDFSESKALEKVISKTTANKRNSINLLRGILSSQRSVYVPYRFKAWSYFINGLPDNAATLAGARVSFRYNDPRLPRGEDGLPLCGIVNCNASQLEELLASPGNVHTIIVTTWDKDLPAINSIPEKIKALIFRKCVKRNNVSASILNIRSAHKIDVCVSGCSFQAIHVSGARRCEVGYCKDLTECNLGSDEVAIQTCRNLRFVLTAEHVALDIRACRSVVITDAQSLQNIEILHVSDTIMETDTDDIVINSPRIKSCRLECPLEGNNRKTRHLQLRGQTGKSKYKQT
jgi:hypothetical protein